MHRPATGPHPDAPAPLSAPPFPIPPSVPPAPPTPLRAWVLAVRPHTLSLSAMPVVAGCALAWAHGATLQWGVALATLLAALLIQAGTNLLNDVGDFRRGADSPLRLGPPRATAQSWLAPPAVQRAGLGALAAAFALGVYLAWLGGWPIVLLGLAALACGWGYTAGPRPIAYGAWGEAFVWLFFGVAAVAGTYWLQTGHTHRQAWLAGHLLGALAAAVLLVNNTRDAATDAQAGRRTLAVRLGLRGCRRLYASLLALPFGLWLLALWPWPAADAGGLFVVKALVVALPLLLLLPWTLALARRFARQSPGTAHNALLAHTARLQVLWTLLLMAACLAMKT